MPVLFQTPRLYIRHYTLDDFENFFRLNGDPEIMRYIRPAQPRDKSLLFLKEIIARYEEQPGLGRWGMFSHSDHEFVGSFAVIPVQNSDKLQLGYSLLKENWGKGYASEAVAGGIRYMFDTLGLTEIAGITFPENTASQKVLLRSGFAFDKMIKEEDGEMNLYMLYKA
jgi:[ribosomal protein S5]-alanine N-acetyltransferase